MDNKNRPIGFFDSGVGGLSVMKEAIQVMPNENYIYFGDSKNAPYGVKSVEEVRDLTFKAVEFLLNKGVKGIAIACNTATSAAVADLRKIYPDLPLVGIEPALKPAVELNKDGNILIMATSMTLKEEKFNRLMNRYKDRASIIPVPCPGLVEFIEAGKLDGKEVEEYLFEKVNTYNGGKIASIVLGCTHYPFIKDTLVKIIGKDITIIDGGLGTAKELRRRLSEKNLLTESRENGTIEIINSSNKNEVIDLSYRLLNK
ncbi:glutamate racemase [Clostridium tertium]|uniref:Glutamate racemase n=1 Tax=Clostridium tertium TaxID=1559 RepID=A0A9X4B1Q5_9CLOT|nr:MULTISPECIES: glutamate racemase [Clostridium]EEH99375.1 glutamate racemase [Clostridium sp. 7_2_43FAA]MDB1940037.1 glutamate racemase [Clostridium tertium]MDB1948476.1 glutamate racemase [Clostridium tertium]MDB1954794.1 glutamate racemase [Clostridium tertium]MDB1959088.1 glutamate racemase [Clostridium tertium]